VGKIACSGAPEGRLRRAILPTSGHPQQNGGHERMHLTLKKEATPPVWDCLQQQDRFDAFIHEYNARDRTRHALAPMLLGSSLQDQAVVVVDPKGEIARLPKH
jgi:hypothetical protein